MDWKAHDTRMHDLHLPLSSLLALRLELLFQLLQSLEQLCPLIPFRITLFKASRKRQPTPFFAPKAPDPRARLLHAHGTPLCNDLLALAYPELQIPHSLEVLLGDTVLEAGVEHVVQTHHESGKHAGQTVDCCNAPNRQDGEEVLPEPGEDVEVVVIDPRGCCDEGLVVNDAVRELAADDVRVSGQLLERRWRDVHHVRHAWVVVSVDRLISQKTSSPILQGAGTNMSIGIGDRSATASNHFLIPIWFVAGAK